VSVDFLDDSLDNVVEDLRALLAKFHLFDGRLGKTVPIMGQYQDELWTTLKTLDTRLQAMQKEMNVSEARVDRFEANLKVANKKVVRGVGGDGSPQALVVGLHFVPLPAG
jgi:hypothetical protein